MKQQTIQHGIEEAFSHWLMQHSPITLPTCLEAAIKTAMDEWLAAHSGLVCDIIGQQVEKAFSIHHLSIRWEEPTTEDP